MKLDDRTLQAVMQLRMNTDFQQFMSWLAAQGETAMQTVLYAKQDIGVAQGRCQALVDIMSCVQDAPAQLEARRNQS